MVRFCDRAIVNGWLCADGGPQTVQNNTLVGHSYLTGSESDPIVVLHPVLVLPVVQPLPADADRHGAQVVIDPKVVLMLCGPCEKHWNEKRKHIF